MSNDIDTDTDVPKKVKAKIGRWDGKVNFEDQVTRTLYAILKESRKTNRLLRKLAGEDETPAKDESVVAKVKRIGGDLLDDGKYNKSNVKKRSKKDRK